MTKILDRIKKLLELSKSSNQHEAALAAARAAELMIDHQISEAQLAPDIADPEPVTEEAIDKDERRVAWKAALVSGLARSLGCECYHSTIGGGVRYFAVGPSDSLKVISYMHSYLVNEISHLADIGYKTEAEECDRSGVRPPSARAWKGSFRIGCANEIYRRLVNQRSESLKRAQLDGKSHALVVVNAQALEIKRFMSKMKLRSGPRSAAGRSSTSGYRAGAAAGRNVSLDRGSSNRLKA